MSFWANSQGMEVKIDNFSTFHQLTFKNIDAWKTINNSAYYEHPEFGALPLDAPCTECVEDLEKRTRDERYFVSIEDNSKFFIQKALGDLHQLVNGNWVTIDHSLHPVTSTYFESGYLFEQGSADVAAKKTSIQTPLGKLDFNQWNLTVVRPNANEIFTANWSNKSVGADGVHITDVFPGIDAEIRVLRGAFKTNFIIKTNEFGTFTELLFTDHFGGLSDLSLAFESGQTNQGIGNLVVSNGSLLVAEMQEGQLYAKEGPKDLGMSAVYSIQNSDVSLHVPFAWINDNIGQYQLIVDPLVTGTGTLAQASITGSMYNASCNFTNSCNYSLTVARPAHATITDVQWTFNYTAAGACWLMDGATRFTAGSCLSPAGAGFYWYCNLVGGGTCTGSNVSVFSDLQSCIPAPGCTPSNVNFGLQFFRSCYGTTGCSNTCIGAGSPWTMTITGQTVNYSNTTTPITLSATTICQGQSITASTLGSLGVPGYTYNWSFSPTGTPSIATGSPATITFPTSGSITLYSIVTDACGNQVTSSRVITVTPGPTATATPSSQTLCTGGTTGITLSGATSYAWTVVQSGVTGASNGSGSSIVQTLSTTGAVSGTATYTITPTSGGCTGNPITVTITVNPNPVITVNSGSTCVGGNLVLTANGGTTYSWSPSATLSSSTGNPVTATPSGTTTYTVTGTAAGCTGTATATVTIVPSPVVTVNSATICQGSSATLTASGATSYTWSPATGLSSTTGSSVTANPTTTTTYTITGTTGSCSGTTTATVTVNPTPVITVNSPTICAGGSATLTASGATSYTWAPPTGLSATTGATVTANPGTTTTYTVTGTTGTCTGTATATVTVTPNPVITVNSPTICAGGSTTLTANGATTYTWSPATGLSSTTGTTVTANPSTTTTYTVTGTIGTCTGTATAIVTVTPNPVVTVNSPTICQGTSATLTANGATSYTWTPSATLSSGTGNPVTASPSTTTTYTVTGTTGTCTGTATATVTITPNPIITVNSPSICAGGSATLTAAGASSYTWSPATGLSSTTGTSVTANPSTTTTYTITGTSGSCSGTTTATVTVTPNPVVTVNSPTICEGTSATLTANGATSYTWTPAGTLSSGTANPVTATPSVTTTYTVTGTSGTCTGTATATVTVTPNPIITVNSATICPGSSATLTANGATSYTWTPSATLSSGSGNPVTANPSTTTTYTVTGTTGTCSGTATSTVTIGSNPVISVTPITICAGSSGTLTASGATNYTWSPATGLSSTSGTSVTANPSTTTTYTVTGTTGTCTGTTTTTVTVSPNPTVTVNSPTICAGASATLTANGATTYTWSPASGLSSTTGTSVTASPSTTTTYTVTGMTGTCTGTTTSTVTVTPTPTISVNSATICGGSPATLTATGALNYTWSPATGLSSTTGSTVTASPSTTTTYTITGTTAGGCIGTTTSTVTVSPNPTITVNSPSYCAGGSATLNAGGATSYTWSPATGLSSTTGNSVTANPATTTTYTITGTQNGCTSTATSTVTVNPNPVVTVSNNGPLCPGDNLQLTVTGAGTSTYSWTGPNTFSSSIQNPTVTNVSAATGGVYSVTVTANGCSASGSTNVVINPGVSSAINPSGPYCENGAVVTLSSVFPGGTWSGPGIVNPSTGSFSPAVAGAGTHVISYDIPGACGGTGTATITVNSIPQVSFTASTNTGCVPLNVVYTNTSLPIGSSVVWTMGANQTATTIGSASAVYNSSGCQDVSLTVVDAAGCANTLTQNSIVCVLPEPDASFNATPTVVSMNSPTVQFINNSQDAVSFNWNFQDGATSSAVNPSHTFPGEPESYTVTLVAYNAAGCTDTARLIIKVQDELLYYVPNSFTPNGDEHNNTFLPVFTSGFDRYKFTFLIFNRWGEIVFESNDATIGWDGTYHGKTAQDGVYTWTVQFRDSENDKKYSDSGHVYLQR